MKSFIRISVTALIVLVFISVLKHVKLENIEQVTSPENLNIPCEGTWQVTDYKLYSSNEADKDELSKMIGKYAVFSNKVASVGSISCENPKYSVKNVNIDQYMALSRNISIDTGIKNSMSEVISVSSGEIHFFDLFIIDDNRAAVLSSGGIVYMDKISEKTEDITEIKSKSQSEISSKKDNVQGEATKSGVLLGIKTTIPAYENKSFLPAYKYRTIWIGRENNAIMSVKEVSNILVPRINGFWKVDMERIENSGYSIDKLISYPIENDTKRNTRAVDLSQDNTDVIQNITYVGSDYISLEYGVRGKDNKLNLNNLKIVPLSTPDQGRIKVSEIFGDKSKDTLVNSAKSFLKAFDQEDNIQKASPSEENIGMFRKNGHWILKGRLNYDNAGGASVFRDFSISLIPDKKVVNYDNLTVSWSDVKSAVPEALDVFESPNSDFIIVVTKNSLELHEIKNNVISPMQSARYKLNESDSIIMSEWATGDYTEKWDKTMSALGTIIN